MSPDPIRFVSGAGSRDAKHACLQPQRPVSVLYRGEQTVDVRTFALLAVQLLAVPCRMRTIPAMQHEPVPVPAQNRLDLQPGDFRRILRIVFYVMPVEVFLTLRDRLRVFSSRIGGCAVVVVWSC